jgi:hypothetical protein
MEILMTVNTITTAPQAARARQCPLCDAPSGEPCQLKPAGDHLARYLNAYTAGQLTKAYMAAVVGELVEIDTSTIVTAEAPACHYCGRTGQPLEPCCARHPDQLVCADVAGCRDFLLAQLQGGAR